MTSVALLMPAVSPGSTSVTSTCQPRVSAQRWYMRRSMFAQSHDSVPPAPALMLMMQLLLSWRPLRKTFSSSESSSLKNLAEVLFQFLLDLGLGGFRLRLAQLDHDVEVFELLLRLEQRFGLVAEGIGLVNELLGLLAVIPEVLRPPSGR